MGFRAKNLSFLPLLFVCTFVLIQYGIHCLDCTNLWNNLKHIGFQGLLGLFLFVHTLESTIFGIDGLIYLSSYNTITKCLLFLRMISKRMGFYRAPKLSFVAFQLFSLCSKSQNFGIGGSYVRFRYNSVFLNHCVNYSLLRNTF